MSNDTVFGLMDQIEEIQAQKVDLMDALEEYEEWLATPDPQDDIPLIERDIDYIKGQIVEADKMLAELRSKLKKAEAALAAEAEADLRA